MLTTTTIITLLIPTLLISTKATAVTPFEMSAKHIADGHIPEARRALESELRLRPKHVEARYNLALLLQQIDKPEEAITLYRHNLSFAWHLPSVVNLASLLKQQGKPEQAKALLQEATHHFRIEATPWYLLAEMIESEGHIQMANKAFLHAIKNDPLNGFSHLRFGAFQSRHKLADRGIKQAARATRLLPVCAPCWRQYGNILMAAGQSSDALSAYQHSLAIDPDDKTRQAIIKLLNHMGEHQRAAHIQRALDMHNRYIHKSAN